MPWEKAKPTEKEKAKESVGRVVNQDTEHFNAKEKGKVARVEEKEAEGKVQ